MCNTTHVTKAVLPLTGITYKIELNFACPVKNHVTYAVLPLPFILYTIELYFA